MWDIKREGGQVELRLNEKGGVNLGIEA